MNTDQSRRRIQRSHWQPDSAAIRECNVRWLKFSLRVRKGSWVPRPPLSCRDQASVRYKRATNSAPRQNLAATQARHRDVGKDRVVTLDLKISQRLLGAICRMTLMRFSEQVVKCLANVVIVIDDQQYG